jgi:hypothetical protein
MLDIERAEELIRQYGKLREVRHVGGSRFSALLDMRSGEVRAVTVTILDAGPRSRNPKIRYWARATTWDRPFPVPSNAGSNLAEAIAAVHWRTLDPIVAEK